jgi:dCMP deaminase
MKKQSKRAGWDRYFLEIAAVAASRSTCERNHVGAVIVRDRIILSTGYNGSMRSMPHCDEAGHAMQHGHCTNTVHAEANAIVQAAYTGVRVKDAAMYVTSSPCWNCFKLIAHAGIKRVVYGSVYGDDLPRVMKTAKKIGIKFQKL